MYLWKKALLLSLFFVFSLSTLAAVPSGNWKTLSTEHFNVHYLPSYEVQAKRSAYISENLYPKLVSKISWQPKDKISVVVIDEHDKANGSATPYPFNKMILRLSPPDEVTKVEDYDDWLALLIEHELTHIFHLDKSAGKVTSLRGIFGRHALLFPNLFQPSWFIEGLATFVETHEGIGRGQSASFEMLMREEVSKGILPVERVNLPADSQPLSRHYLYGVYFYQFLKESYGEQSITRLINSYSDNLLPFSINSNSRSVLGKDINQLWSEFSLYLTSYFSKQINLIGKSNINQGKALTSKPIQLSSLGFLDKNTIIYIDNNYESSAQLVKLKATVKVPLVEVNNNTKFKVGSNDKVYLAQVDYCDEYHVYYDIYRYDLIKDEIKQLTECSRYKYFALSESNDITAVKTVASIPQIDLLDKNAKFIKTLWQGVYGDVISDIDWSEKRNKLLITKKELNKSWNIYEFDLEARKWSDVVLDNAIFMQAKYSANEDGIVFTSDVSGVFNIYEKTFNEPSYIAITNVLGGAFSPVEHDNKLFYQHFERDGYRIFSTKIEKMKVPLIKPSKSIVARFDKNIDDKTLGYEIKSYSPWQDLSPKYWFPWLLIQDNTSEIGFITSSNDSLDHHFYQLNLTYGYDQKDISGSFFYQYENWLSFALSKENIFYTDSASNLTDLIRENQQFQLRFTLPFTKFKERWRFNLGLIDNQEKDSYLASGVSGFPDHKDGLVGFSVFYDSKRLFLKGNSTETGRDVLLVTESSDVLSSNYAGNSTTLDWREYFQLGSHHTIALRYVSGVSDTTMRPYRIGGLKSDWDSVTVFNYQVARTIFNKRNFSLRGYSENTQIGNNLELATMEWRFPLLHVEKGIMAPPVGVMKHSGRFFVEAGTTWFDSQQKQPLRSVGVEWLIDLNVFYRITPQVRLGYAEGLDETGDQYYYLKIGGAF